MRAGVIPSAPQTHARPGDDAMKIAFEDLPYPANALEPHYATRMVELHYGKHHRTYFDTTVKLINGTKYEDMTLEEIILAAAKNKEKSGPELFNNSAQIWNHNMFWHSMRPGGGGEPEGELKQLITDGFGSYGDFRKQISEKAVKQFGSGWAWLVYDKGKLAVRSTGNADNPLTSGATTLIALDVWEHAYYVEYENRRPEYVEKFLDHLLNWQHAEKMLHTAAEAHASHGHAPRRAAGGRR
jgi:Fe-Mn family superoxide dismutase